MKNKSKRFRTLINIINELLMQYTVASFYTHQQTQLTRLSRKIVCLIYSACDFPDFKEQIQNDIKIYISAFLNKLPDLMFKSTKNKNIHVY